MSESYVTLGQICDKGSSNIAQKDLAEREGKYPIYGAAGFIKNVDFAHQKRPYIAVVKDGAGIGRVMKLPAYSSVIGTMQYIFPKENVDIDYLFYALQYMNLGKYFSGSTIPHIYFRDYQKGRLKLPAMKVQQHQAETLSRIDALFSCRQKQIALLDEIVKSQFVEMFGDPEQNPLEWPIKKLAAVVSSITAGWSANGEARPRKAGEKAVLKVSAVTQGFFKPDEYKVIPADLEIKKYVYPKKGDLLFSRANTRELVGATAVIEEDYPELLLPDKLWKVLFTNEMDVYYAKHILSTHAIRKVFSSQSTGTSGSMYNVSAEKFRETFRETLIPVPPIMLQREFAAFVAQVDKSKVEIQKAIDQLEILKKSLMQQYFG